MANIVENSLRAYGTPSEIKKFIKFFSVNRTFNIDFNKIIPLVNDDEVETWGARLDYDINGGCTHGVLKHIEDDDAMVFFHIFSKWSVPDKAFKKLCVMFPDITIEAHGIEPMMGWKYLMTIQQEPNEPRTEDNVVFEYFDFTNYDTVVNMWEFNPTQ